MRKIITFLLVILSSVSYCQQTPIDAGGGEVMPLESEHVCLSGLERDSIQVLLKQSHDLLVEKGVLSDDPIRDVVEFIWPLQQADGFEWNSYYGISNYVDQDLSEDGLLDYHCDERTYDGHMGTDIFTWPFPWYMYENDLVEVIAAEEGVILQKFDLNEDDHCECFGMWNAVYVEHSDGSVAWYGHLKSGSLTSKEIGDPVSQGEFLGVVASSGCSTGPHLHLEVYDNEGNLIDPYLGDCNDMNDETWWEEQPENREPTLNVVLTHDVVPEHGCPLVNEDPHFQNDFYPGDVVYTAFYFHDATAGSSATYKIIDPTGEVWNEWDQTMGTTYNASWWWWYWSLPDDGPFGVWTVEGEYGGETVTHEFNYGIYASMDETNDSGKLTVYPNPGNGQNITISGLEVNTPLRIFNAAGQQVFAGHNNQQELKNLHLAPGIYFIQLMVDNQIQTIKYSVSDINK
jgi:hypothetical protein